MRRRVVMSAVLIGLLAVPAVTASALGAPACGGLAATIRGSSGADLLIGTEGNDVIAGLGGDDTILAKGGNDVVCAGSGDDNVRGGAGDDLILGGPGVDDVTGGHGLDSCRGESRVTCEGMALDPGDSGAAVVNLQQWLRARALFRGRVDGVYGPSTVSAVVAFHKVMDRTRSGSWLASDWDRLAAFVPTPPITRPGEPDRIEIDIGHQVLFLIEGGEVSAIAPVSTGGGYTYLSERSGQWVTARTPRGDFHLRWYGRGWRCDPVTTWCVYDYWSFSTYYGIHGYRNVPTYPASHGCVRLNTWDSDRLTPRFFVGMPVHIWDTAP